MMAFRSVIVLALLLAGDSAWSSHPSESARNQYEAREERPQPNLLTEATDHRPEVHVSQQAGENSTNSTKQLSAPDLQVGCGDGFIQEKVQPKSELDKNEALTKKVLSKTRRRRSYRPWSRQTDYSVPYRSISVWQPPIYQLSRPYFIPVYGVSGRIPIYYPPQPLYINSGTPKDNPAKKPFTGPTYLPPRQRPETSTMTVGNRDGGGEYYDGNPIWYDDNNQQRPQRPFTTTTERIPTRAPPPGANRDPPLIHNPEQGGQSNTIDGSFESNNRFTTLRPPAAQPPRRPTARPPARPNDPSRCVWAIISCCSSSTINYDCFEQSGCPGAFWDNNPCENEFAQSAIAAALNYYNKK